MTQWMRLLAELDQRLDALPPGILITLFMI